MACSFDDSEWREWLPCLRDAFSGSFRLLRVEEANADELASAKFLLAANPMSLPTLPKLLFVQSLWAGVDKLLKVLRVETLVARMVDPYMLMAMAETAVWSVLTCHRGFHKYQVQQRGCEWKQLRQVRAEDIHVLLVGGTGQVRKKGVVENPKFHV